MTTETITPTDLPAASDPLEDVAAILRTHNIEAIVVDTGDQARETVLGLIPDGAEVHSGKSRTLEDIGLYSELFESGRFDGIRPRMFKMDRATQGREIRKMVASPDFMVGSVAAITRDGTLVAASAIGGQLAAYAAGAGRLILVVGSQKLVPDLDAAMRRIDEVVYPYENEQVQARMGVDTMLAKVLLMYREWQPGRTTVVLVREPVGI